MNIVEFLFSSLAYVGLEATPAQGDNVFNQPNANVFLCVFSIEKFKGAVNDMNE